MSTKNCWGVEFDRHGKHWAWCCYDGFVFEITPAPKTCTRCGRPWTPVPATEEEMKRIHPHVEQFVDFPYYKVRAAELEAENVILKARLAEAERVVRAKWDAHPGFATLVLSALQAVRA